MFEVGLDGIEHGIGPILVMRAGDDDLVRREQRFARCMEILVSDHVCCDALGLQPVHQVEVGREARRRGPDPVAKLRTHIEDWLQPRSIADPGAIDMKVVQAE